MIYHNMTLTHYPDSALYSVIVTLTCSKTETSKLLITFVMVFLLAKFMCRCFLWLDLCNRADFYGTTIAQVWNSGWFYSHLTLLALTATFILGCLMLFSSVIYRG